MKGRRRVVVACVLAAGAAHAAAPLPLRDGVPTLAPLLRDVTPAVVNISIKEKAFKHPDTRFRYSPLFRDPFFRRFFDLPDDDAPARPPQSVGSGVIVDAGRGYVLSNHHVVAGADSVTVTLKNNRRLDAEVLGSDPGTDIALLRIEAEGLAALPMGDSDALEVGDFVIAIGSLRGLGQTVTSGIVSGLKRQGVNPQSPEGRIVGSLVDFIQTDAAINSGNSGGALVNLRGELVGINAAKQRMKDGIGFAVPINTADETMNQLVKNYKMQREWIGFVPDESMSGLVEAYRQLDPDFVLGVRVSHVEPGSPIETAGIQVGDYVVAVNGSPVDGSRNFRNYFAQVWASGEFDIEVQREGSRIRLDVRVGDAPVAADVPSALEGATLRDLEQGDLAYGRIEGVIAAEVARGSRAAHNGIRPGDVIFAVNRRPVRDAGELVRAFERAGPLLALNIMRGFREFFIVIDSSFPVGSP